MKKHRLKHLLKLIRTSLWDTYKFDFDYTTETLKESRDIRRVTWILIGGAERYDIATIDFDWNQVTDDNMSETAMSIVQYLAFEGFNWLNFDDVSILTLIDIEEGLYLRVSKVEADETNDLLKDLYEDRLIEAEPASDIFPHDVKLTTKSQQLLHNLRMTKFVEI